jgi:hypothetical protein
VCARHYVRYGICAIEGYDNLTPFKSQKISKDKITEAQSFGVKMTFRFSVLKLWNRYSKKYAALVKAFLYGPKTMKCSCGKTITSTKITV